MTFADIGKAIGRDETAVAAVFYGHHQVSPEDITGLSQALDIPESTLHEQIPSYPYRGHVMEMPPKEPLIYRLYEVIQNYGYAYKAIMNEKFGDGIMSAVTFSTKVEKETDEKGDWVKITMRGKWFVRAPLLRDRLTNRTKVAIFSILMPLVTSCQY